MSRRKSAKRDEFVDGVEFAAATVVAAFDQGTIAEHLMGCVGWKRGLPLDEKHLRGLRQHRRERDAAKRLRRTR
jgi:hypothetical protein